MDKYNIESSSSFFLAEALEHGFTMADAALGGKRGGGGSPARQGRRRRLLGGADAVAQGGAARVLTTEAGIGSSTRQWMGAGASSRPW
jgi:hypothetical protein